LIEGLLWAFLTITKVANIFGLIYFTGKSCVLILAKIRWATYWAIFSQTYLVTLVGIWTTGANHAGR
jgi:hypothetical protein